MADEPGPSGVVMDRLAMALIAALEELRQHVPNHHPVRVQARKAVDGWVEYSASVPPCCLLGETEGVRHASRDECIAAIEDRHPTEFRPEHPADIPDPIDFYEDR